MAYGVAACAVWGCRVEIAGAAHHTEATVAGVVVAQLEGDCEERGPQLPLLAAILQRWVEAAIGSDRPTVQRKPLRVSLLPQ